MTSRTRKQSNEILNSFPVKCHVKSSSCFLRGSKTPVQQTFFPFLQLNMSCAMNTGHDGSLTTLHAGTAKEAILRLVLMARFGMDLPADIIEEQIASALDLIVMAQRLPDGRRYVTSISELFWQQDRTICIKECISFDVFTRQWHLNHVPSFITAAEKERRLSQEEVERWEKQASCVFALQ